MTAPSVRDDGSVPCLVVPRVSQIRVRIVAVREGKPSRTDWRDIDVGD